MGRTESTVKLFPLRAVLAFAAAMAALFLGAAFLIAPIYQPGYHPMDAAPAQIQRNTESEARMDLNTATLEDLKTLPGVGDSKAQAILNYRIAHGGFSSVEELANVSGISADMVNQWKDKICINTQKGG